MRFEAWDSDYFADDLIGAFELDLAWVWQQEHHEIQQTWVALADTKVRGYLLVSVAIVPEGFELNTVAPVRDGPADLSVALLPPSVEVTVKELHVKVYYAEDVVALDEDGGNDLYARVSYGNQSVQSSVVQNSVWQEALMVPVVSPRLDREMVSQRVKLALCDGDRLGRDDVVGVAYINLADVPQLGDSPHSKMWGVPTWLDLYGAPAHAGGSSNEGGSKLLRKFGQQFESSRDELTRQMNSGVLPGSAYRGRVMICAFLQDVNEARIGVLKMPDIQKVHPSGHAREVAELTRLRLESLVSAPIKQKDTRQTRLPQSRWRDMSLDQHNPESSKATPGSLLVCLASDAGVPRPVPSRSQPRAPEHGLCVIRALILEGHDLQRTAKLRSQWASINLRVGAATVSTRRVELQDDDSETFGCSSRVQWNELLELVVARPKGRDGRLLPPDAFLELMLGSAFGEQKRLSYTRIDASEFLKLNPDCLIQETLSKELYKDTVLGAGYIPWTANAFGVRCVNGTNLHKTDKFSNPDYYVRVTLYSGPDGQVPTPDKIRQEQQVSSLSYSAPSRTQDVQLNKDGVAVWDELFRFGTPQPAGEYTMPGVRVVVVDVFDEDTGRDDHVGRAVIRVRNTDHGYEVDHSGTSGERDFRPVGDTNVHGWPLFYYTGESRRQQGTINLVFTQHAFVPEKEWSYDNDVETYEMRVHVFSAQQLRLQDSDGVNEVFVRASMGSSRGRTMDGRSKPFTKTRSGPGPVWNQTLVFDDVQLMPPEWIQAGLSPRLVLTLWDRDTGSTPDFLARCCISSAQIFEASSKMDSYIARESGHPARWYPLVEQDCATRAGNVLLAFEICKSAEAGERTWLDSTFSDKQRSSGKCTPPVRKCRLEMLVVGCRNLKSWGLTEPTAPYVELSVSNKKGGVGKSASTMPRRKPRPTSPSYVDDRLLILECELPEDTLFEPHAIATIRDSDGKYTPGAKKVLGYSRIDLSQHLPWVQQNQESRSRQLVDQMVREQKVRARKRNLCRLSIGGSDPQLCAALEMDEVEPWDELPLAKLDLERALYALLIAEEQFESYRAIKPDDEFVIRKHQSLVDQALVQCEKIAATALQLVEFNLRQNPAAENQTLQLWRVIETDRPYSRGMQQFKALPLVIDSTAADDVRGSADADDVKDFRRHALRAEQLGMKLCLICCERLAVAVASDVPAHDEPSLLTRGAAALHDIDTLAQKCDAYAMCIRESAKSFGKIGKQTSRHAKLTQLMASECLEQCRALLMEADDAAKTKAIQSVCSALEDKVKALEMLPDLVASGSGTDTPACQSSCEKLACCWCNGVAEQPQFSRLAETDINQLVAAVGHERLDFHYNLPMWMLNRKVIDDELEDELDRLSTSFRTMMTWRIVDSDGEVGLLKGVIRVVDISADSSEPQPEPEPETDMSMFGNRPVAAVSHIPTNSVMELPFPRLLPELLRNFELIARVYVTQAFLSFQDSSKLLGADADWYIKVFLNGDSLDDQSVSVTAGDPTRPYLGCVFEFPVLLPGPSALRLELHDRDKFSHDELIGATDIDLEDRYFNEGWRALGQPVHATTSILAQIASNGPAQAATADDIHAQKTPSPSKFAGCSRLLSLMSSSNRNTTGSDEDQEPLQALEVGRASVEGSHSVPVDADAELDLEREDDSQLTLQKPIERRTLRLPGSKRLQGKLEMWIDLLTKPQAALLDPVDIRPPQIQRFELRVVVWSVRTCPISDWLTSASDLTVSTDLHVVESEDEREPTLLTQDTDTHCALHSTLQLLLPLRFLLQTVPW